MRPVRYFFLTALLAVVFPMASGVARAAAPASAPESPSPVALTPSAMAARDDARIAEQAYLYAYPLVLMDLTRRQATNVNAGPAPDRGPANQFVHVVPQAATGEQSATEAARSLAWIDLEEGPIVLSLPDTRGRDYALTLSDMWGDVIAVLGKRTTGTTARELLVVPQGWAGTLPSNLATITATTVHLRARLRVQTFGSGDGAAAQALQNSFAMTPLSARQSSGQAVHLRADPGINMLSAPRDQIARMTPVVFYAYVADLLRRHAPHATDQPLIARMARIGIKPGQRLRVDDLPQTTQRALRIGAAAAQVRLDQSSIHPASLPSGWRLPTPTQGVYGNDYLGRARAAWAGESGVSAEDEWRAVAVQDGEGAALDGAHAYTLRFEADTLPPGLTAWSLRATDVTGDGAPRRSGLLTDRSPLVYNADGSLDLVVQHDPPARADHANWLRLPAGATSVILHLFTPDAAAIDGVWMPPALARAN